MTKDEALKMAIEVLNEHEPDWECNQGYHHNQCPNVDCNCKEKKYWKTLDDCKKAIESYFEIGIKSYLDKGSYYTYRILPDKNGLYWLLKSDLKEALEQPTTQEPIDVVQIKKDAEQTLQDLKAMNAKFAKENGKPIHIHLWSLAGELKFDLREPNPETMMMDYYLGSIEIKQATQLAFYIKELKYNKLTGVK